jgi:methyl-accepting chemotaxis protein
LADRLAKIQTATGEAVGAIRAIANTIQDISAIATAIAAAVEQQGAATAEIARNVQQTAPSTWEVTANMEGVRRASSETGAAAGTVLDAARGVSRQAGLLQGEVASFIAEVKST